MEPISFACDDVQRLDMSGIAGGSEDAPLVRLNNVRVARLRDLNGSSGPLVEIAGGATAGISVQAPQDRVRLASGAPAREVVVVDR